MEDTKSKTMHYINTAFMKKGTLLFGMFLIVTIKAYTQDVSIGEYTRLDLTHFKQFFNKDNPDVPLDTLHYIETESYSYDKKFFIQRFPHTNTYRLWAYGNTFITEIPYTSVYDRIIWLQNSLVVENDIEDFNHPVIYLVNLKDGKLSIYKAKGRINYIGHSDSSCYFYSTKDSTSFTDLFIPNENTIFSINENGLMLTNKKEREDKNRMIRMYYNEFFSLIMNKDTAGKWSYNFHYYNSIWNYNEPISYFSKEDVYLQHGIAYVKINSKAIYRFDRNNVTKVADCDTLSIDQFIVDNNHLLYNIPYHYQKPPIHILNLDTKKTFCPVIIRKDD